MNTNAEFRELSLEELAQVNGGSAFTEWLGDAWDWFTGAGQNSRNGKIGNGNPNMSGPFE